MQSRNPKGIPPPAHIFNPESRPDFALKSRILSFRQGKSPGQVLGFMFAGYVPLASQSPYPIIVYNYYRPHLSHFLENVIFAIPT